MSESYDNCRFAGPGIQSWPSDLLMCRRNPPIIMPELVSAGSVFGWPPVDASSWCGEWKLHDVAPATTQEEAEL